MVRLKRRMATSNGSFSLTRIPGIACFLENSLDGKTKIITKSPIDTKSPFRFVGRLAGKIRFFCGLTMRVLGIETSCDETGCRHLRHRRGLLGHRLHSQIDLHAAYGGVVPELASRDHVRRLPCCCGKPWP